LTVRSELLECRRHRVLNETSRMRISLISGFVLIAVGLWIILRPPSYSREESVFRLGDIEAKMQRQHPVPGWLGGLALGVGGVLVVAGMRKPR